MKRKSNPSSNDSKKERPATSLPTSVSPTKQQQQQQQKHATTAPIVGSSSSEGKSRRSGTTAAGGATAAGLSPSSTGQQRPPAPGLGCTPLFGAGAGPVQPGTVTAPSPTSTAGGGGGGSGAPRSLQLVMEDADHDVFLEGFNVNLSGERTSIGRRSPLVQSYLRKCTIDQQDFSKFVSREHIDVWVAPMPQQQQQQQQQQQSAEVESAIIGQPLAPGGGEGGRAPAAVPQSQGVFCWVQSQAQAPNNSVSPSTKTHDTAAAGGGGGGETTEMINFMVYVQSYNDATRVERFSTGLQEKVPKGCVTDLNLYDLVYLCPTVCPMRLTPRPPVKTAQEHIKRMLGYARDSLHAELVHQYQQQQYQQQQEYLLQHAEHEEGEEGNHFLAEGGGESGSLQLCPGAAPPGDASTGGGVSPALLPTSKASDGTSRGKRGRDSNGNALPTTTAAGASSATSRSVSPAARKKVAFKPDPKKKNLESSQLSWSDSGTPQKCTNSGGASSSKTSTTECPCEDEEEDMVPKPGMSTQQQLLQKGDQKNKEGKNSKREGDGQKRGSASPPPSLKAPPSLKEATSSFHFNLPTSAAVGLGGGTHRYGGASQMSRSQYGVEDMLLQLERGDTTTGGGGSFGFSANNGGDSGPKSTSDLLGPAAGGGMLAVPPMMGRQVMMGMVGGVGGGGGSGLLPPGGALGALPGSANALGGGGSSSSSSTFVLQPPPLHQRLSTGGGDYSAGAATAAVGGGRGSTAARGSSNSNAATTAALVPSLLAESQAVYFDHNI